MEPEVIAALVAAAAALVVATTSLVTSVWTRRQADRSAKDLEEFKFELTSSLREQHLLDLSSKAAIQSLKAGLTAIQRMKDEIQLILTATGKSLRSRTARGRVGEARDEINSMYEEHHVNLSMEDAPLLHSAKSLANRAHDEVGSALAPHTYAADINDASRETLGLLRAALTEQQETVRNALELRLIERIAQWRTS